MAGLFRIVYIGVFLPRFAQKFKLGLDTESRKMQLIYLSLLAYTLVSLLVGLFLKT